MGARTLCVDVEMVGASEEGEVPRSGWLTGDLGPREGGPGEDEKEEREVETGLELPVIYSRSHRGVTRSVQVTKMGCPRPGFHHDAYAKIVRCQKPQCSHMAGAAAMSSRPTPAADLYYHRLDSSRAPFLHQHHGR
jgi:hypothetical protein